MWCPCVSCLKVYTIHQSWVWPSLYTAKKSHKTKWYLILFFFTLVENSGEKHAYLVTLNLKLKRGLHFNTNFSNIQFCSNPGSPLVFLISVSGPIFHTVLEASVACYNPFSDPPMQLITTVNIIYLLLFSYFSLLLPWIQASRISDLTTKMVSAVSLCPPLPWLSIYHRLPVALRLEISICSGAYIYLPLQPHLLPLNHKALIILAYLCTCQTPSCLWLLEHAISFA